MKSESGVGRALWAGRPRGGLIPFPVVGVRTMAKKYNDGQWDESRFRSFMISALRRASRLWPPRKDVLRRSRLGNGQYRCAGYKRPRHEVRYRYGVTVDHIDPVVDAKGVFTTWDFVIERMFVDGGKMQVLCLTCHRKKTGDERRHTPVRDRRSVGVESNA